MIPEVVDPSRLEGVSAGQPKELHRVFFARLKEAPPLGTIQFYDGFFPALKARTYTIKVTHSVAAPSGTPPAYKAEQAFIVQAPEFTIDPNIVASTYPANGSSAVLNQQLPNIVLTDPSLPWERTLTPPKAVSEVEVSQAPSWVALVLFAEGEIYLKQGSSGPLQTMTVKELLTGQDGVLGPQIPLADVSAELQASQCQTIRIPGTSFAVIPSTADLAYLAHCRAVNAPNEDPGLTSVLLANRLPLANGSSPLRYYAHLISLEGFEAYIGPNPKPIPEKTGGGLVDVEFVSLYSWTFTAMPQVGASFESVVQGLIDSESATATLNLPVAEQQPDSPMKSRLEQGYAPLTFISGEGDESFAWYRGPLSAVAPQPLPAKVLPEPAGSTAASADALMIYLAEQGLFDLSYAAAWNMGRGLALADSVFSLAVRNYRHNATLLLNQAAKVSVLGLQTTASAPELLDRQAVKLSFSHAIGEGLGARWINSLAATHRHGRIAGPMRKRMRAQSRPIAARSLFRRPDLLAAIEERMAEAADPVANWLVDLANLMPLPFSSLVPSPAMLPVNSIRFFYVDPAWIRALTAGALSIAVQTQQDVELIAAMQPSILRRTRQLRAERLRRRHRPTMLGGENDVTISGVLLRSELVANWPGLAISATQGGAPSNIVRDATLAPSVRMVLFEGVPDAVTLAEPYHGLQFGVEDKGVAARYVTSAGPIGGQIPNTFVPPTGGYQAFLTQFCGNGGVISIASLAAALAAATGAGSAFGAGDLALQMVREPELQSFTATQMKRISRKTV